MLNLLFSTYIFIFKEFIFLLYLFNKALDDLYLHNIFSYLYLYNKLIKFV